MEFWASSEAHQPAGVGVEKSRRAVVEFIRAAIASSILEGLRCTVRYVPIVMPDEMKSRYPTRSKLQKSKSTYDCAPQLNYDIFVSGTFEEQLREYLRGLSEAIPHLKGLGANDEQASEFENILNSAFHAILSEKHENTRD